MEFIVAGYDADQSPHIYRIAKPDWAIQEYKTPYGQGGSGRKSVLNTFEQGYRSNMTLSEGNVLAVDAMKEACKASPDSVGGKIRLWNMDPSLGVTKFRPADVRKLALKMKLIRFLV